MSRNPRLKTNTAPAFGLRRGHYACGRNGLYRPSDGTVRPLRCKSWACRRCAAWHAARWTERLVIADFQPNVFVTFTLDPERLAADGIGLEDYRGQHRWLLAAMRKVWQIVRRETNEACERWAANPVGPPPRAVRYWRVYEWHRGDWDRKRQVENHRMHVHALVESVVDGGGTRETYDRNADPWRAIANRAGLGIALAYDLPAERTKAEALSLARNYCAKYLSKQKSAAHAYRVRLTASSRGIPPLEKEPCTDPMHLVLAPNPRYGHQSAVLALRAGCRLARAPKPGTYTPWLPDLLSVCPIDMTAHPLLHGVTDTQLSPGLALHHDAIERPESPDLPGRRDP